MESVSRRSSFLAYIISILILILPVADIYASPWFSSLNTAISIILLYPLAFLYYYKNEKVKANYIFLRYFHVAIYISFISFLYGSFGNTEVFFLMGVVFILGMTTSPKLCRPFVKTYLFFSLLFSSFLIIQYVGLAFSHPIEGLITFLPRNIEVESSIRESILYSRISSVFTEPSHFALYVLPSAGLLLFNILSPIKYRRIKLAIIVVSVILSTSGNGIILLVILFGFYIIGLLKRKKFKFQSYLTIFFLLSAIFFIYSSEFVRNTTENIFVAQSTDSSKADYRIYRGFLLYSEIPLDAKILGCGWGNAEKYLNRNDSQLLAKYREGDIRFDYFNSIAGFLIYTGIIGTSLFFYFLYFIYKRCKTNETKALFMTIVATLFSSSLFMSAQWQIYLLFLYSLINVNQLKYEGVYSSN